MTVHISETADLMFREAADSGAISRAQSLRKQHSQQLAIQMGDLANYI